MQRQHSLTDGLVAIPTVQRGGHLATSLTEVALRSPLIILGFSRKPSSCRHGSDMAPLMFSQRRDLLIGGAFELVVEAMIAALGMETAACWVFDDELDFAALAGGWIRSDGCASVAYCVGVHQSAIADWSLF
jgi:hypothetical protein